MPHVPLPDNPLRRTRIQVTIILTNNNNDMELTTLNWDEIFSRRNSDYTPRENAIVDDVKFSVIRKMATKGLRVRITKNGETCTTNVIDRFIGTICIIGSHIDEEGNRIDERKFLMADVDCEVCSYLYNNQVWYHIIHMDSRFSRGEFTRTLISGREVEITDK